MLAGRDRVQARLLQQVDEGIRARTPGVTVHPAVTDLLLDEGKPVAAVPGPLDLQVSLLLPSAFRAVVRSSCWAASLVCRRLEGSSSDASRRPALMAAK